MSSKGDIKLKTLRAAKSTLSGEEETFYYIRCPINGQMLYVNEKNKVRTANCMAAMLSEDYLWSIQFLSNGVTITNRGTKYLLTRSTFHAKVMPELNKRIKTDSDLLMPGKDEEEKKKEESEVEFVDDSKQKWDIILMANGICMIRSYDNNCYLSVDAKSVRVQSTNLVPKTGSLFELIPSQIVRNKETIDFTGIKKDFFDEGFMDYLKAALDSQNENGCEEGYEDFDSMLKKMRKITMRLSDESRQAKVIRLAIGRMRSKLKGIYDVGFSAKDKRLYMTQHGIF